MEKRGFICELLSDVVLNSSLATEGNMESLDYIPGSNFLGIVAEKYKDFNDKAYNIFHNGKVKFGNAYILINDTISLPVPKDLVKPKDENNKQFYLNHSLKHSDPDIVDLQLKPSNQGYLNNKGEFIKNLSQTFTLKSARDMEKGRSEKSKMFGFNSLTKGQKFYFEVTFEDNTIASDVVNALTGIKRLGKSKSAEFGLVKISDANFERQFNSFTPSGYTLVYAASNLCFFDENGQPTFQPEVRQLGLDTGEIDWSRSIIRAYSYSPWNTKRKGSDPQRDCIHKGSVFYVRNAGTDKAEGFIGEYQADGLGRVLYNPSFLEPKEKGRVKLDIKKYNPDPNNGEYPVESKLGKILLRKKADDEAELEMARVIQEEINGNFTYFEPISNSQWGRVRSFAEEAIFKSKNDLSATLKTELSKGHAAERFWDKGAARNLLVKYADDKNKGAVFIAKLASEVAKKINRNKNIGK